MASITNRLKTALVRLYLSACLLKGGIRAALCAMARGIASMCDEYEMREVALASLVSDTLMIFLQELMGLEEKEAQKVTTHVLFHLGYVMSARGHSQIAEKLREGTTEEASGEEIRQGTLTLYA